MTSTNISLLTLTTLGLLALSPSARAAAFVEWNYTLPNAFDKGMNEIAATGTRGAGNTFTGFNTSNPDNFSNSKVFDSSRGYSLRSQTTTSEILLAQTGTTSADMNAGKVYVVVDFAGWNLPTTGASRALNLDAAGNSSGGSGLMAFRLQSSNGKVALDYYSYSGDGWSSSSKPTATVWFNAAEEDILIAMELDRATNTGTLYYKLGDAGWTKTGLTTALGGTNRTLTSLKLGEHGQLGTINDELYYFDIRSISVTSDIVIPEPSTYALVGAAVVFGIAFAAKRRRNRNARTTA